MINEQTIKDAIYKLLELDGQLTYAKVYTYLDIEHINYHPSIVKATLEDIIKADKNVYRKNNGVFIYKKYKPTSSVESVESEKLADCAPVAKKTLTSEIEDIISNFKERPENEFSTSDIYAELDANNIEYKKPSVSVIMKNLVDSNYKGIERVGRGKFYFA